MNKPVEIDEAVQAPLHDGDYHEAIVIGAGMCGLYQLHRLIGEGIDAIALDANPDVGGTWYNNRYPGCRFDSESYTYGFKFSETLLREWDWKEQFSPQPDNLAYTRFVANRLGLRPHIAFNAMVSAAHFDEAETLWRLALADGRSVSCRYLMTAVGGLSAPTLPRVPGISDFEGPWFHTYNWPHDRVELEGKRVGVVGTGATGVQLIAEIADKVGELFVFQRRPNWCAPLNNKPITPQEMDAIRARFDEIFAICDRTPGGFVHEPDRRGFYSVSREERLALWERLYTEPGFGIWLQNFREIFVDEQANAEFSDFIASKIRQRVNDPATAEKLIPKDHGFGIQRVPLETRYYEAYNRDTVHLVSLLEEPIERVTRTGIETGKQHYPLDLIVYATGFDAVTGSFDRIDFRGRGGLSLKQKWRDGPVTYMATMVHGFPNLFLLVGPQSAGSSTNFPRAIELCVDWTTELLQHLRHSGKARMEPSEAAEEAWCQECMDTVNKMLLRKARSWFTGYNSNVEGHSGKKPRPYIWAGGTPKYRERLREVAEKGYQGFDLR